MTDLSGIFGKPFPEQVAAWRLRLQELRPTATWTDVGPEFHDQGFMVAGAMKADLLADLAAAVDKAIVEGRSLEEFRKDFRATVARRGWHGWAGEGSVKGEAWRTRVIYRTNLATTYAAGRRAQLVDGRFAFWVYRHGGSREPRPLHLQLNGIALPPDHRFWLTHSPPNGWGCSCYVVGARTAAGVRRVGGDPDKPLPAGWDSIDPETGTPRGIDKGWAYAPGLTTAGTVNTIKDKIPRLPADIGAALFHSAARRGRLDELVQDFGLFLDKALSSRIERNYMVIGALKPQWLSAAQPLGVRPQSAEIAVTDAAIQHTFRGTPHVTTKGRPTTRLPKAAPLDLAWYRDLPRHLVSPRAVLLDNTQKDPVFLLIYDVPGSHAKLVVEVDTPVKKAGGVLNLVQTGRLIQPGDLATTIGRGIVLIEGVI